MAASVSHGFEDADDPHSERNAYFLRTAPENCCVPNEKAVHDVGVRRVPMVSVKADGAPRICKFLNEGTGSNIEHGFLKP